MSLSPNPLFPAHTRMGVGVAGPQEEKAIGRFLHDPPHPERVDDGRTHGASDANTPALRALPRLGCRPHRSLEEVWGDPQQL